MALADILTSIKDEADGEVAKLEKQHAQELDELSKQHEKELSELKSEVKEGLKKEAENYVLREQHVLSMNRKNSLLSKKQELISEVIDAALEKMSGLDEAAYTSFVSELFKEVDGTGFTIQPCVGRESETQAAMKASGKEFEIGDSIECKGGFKAISGTLEIDNTFESLFAADREEIRLQASQLMFA